MLRPTLLLIILSLLLSANLSIQSPKQISLKEPFEINASQPIFDTNITYTHQPLLECTPVLHAAYRVNTTKQLRIIPQEPLLSDTTYHCQYQTYPITFTTQPLKLTAQYLYPKLNLLRITFNDQIDPSTISKGIKIYKRNQLNKTELHFTLVQHNHTTLLIKINEPIEDHHLELTITPWLRTPQGANLKKPLSIELHRTLVTLHNDKKAMRFQEPPRMIPLDDGRFAIRLFHEDTLLNPKQKYIYIEGIQSFTIQPNQYISDNMRRSLKLSPEVYFYTDIISPEFQPNQTYHLTLRQGLQSYQELKKEKHYTLKTGDRAKSILFTQQEKPYISRYGELSFKSVNLNHATLIVERLLDQNLRYFLNFSQGRKRDVLRYSKELFSKEITLNNPKNVITQQKFKLSSIAKPLPFGIHRISFRYHDGNKERQVSKIVFLSNLGISVNLAKDQALITTLSLDHAKPIPDATVDIYDQNNECIGTGSTNSDGVAIISIPNLLQQHPKGIIVTHHIDKNFLTLNHSIKSPQPRELLQKEPPFRAYIYLQSQLIRPKGVLNAMIVLKDHNFTAPANIPLRIAIQKRYSKEIFTSTVHTDKDGLINFHYPFEAADLTGEYLLNLYLGKEKLASKHFKVEAFMPPKIETRLSTNKPNYYLGESIDLNISTAYLFGAPASNLHGHVTLEVLPTALKLKKYKAYSFDYPQRYKFYHNNNLYLQEDILLDQEGHSSLILPTQPQDDVPSILRGVIGVTIMDDTQPVATYHEVTLFPYRTMVGIHLNQTEIQKGESIKGKVVLIEPKTQQPIQRKLYAHLKKILYHYSYSNGNYHWEKELQEVNTFEVMANKPFDHTIHESGEYLLEIEDLLDGHKAACSFEVWWENYSNIAPQDDLESLEIHFEDTPYQKGDTIKAMIKSPILEGELYVMLEQDRIIEYQHHKLHQGVAQIQLPITQEIKKGAYVHAIVYRPSDQESQLIPFRAIGYHYVHPNRKANQIEIQLTTPEILPSHSILPIKISTSQPARVMLSVIDQAILTLADQPPAEPFKFFTPQRKKHLAYFDLYDELLAYRAQGRLIDFGAGVMEAFKKHQKHLAPDLAQRIKPFKLWAGPFDLSMGTKEVNLTIPQFNGKAIITAIALNTKAIGATQRPVIIQDPLLIKPSFPRFLRQSDQLLVPIRLFNNTNNPHTITLEANSSNQLTLELPDHPLTIPPHGEVYIPTTLIAQKEGKGVIDLRLSDASSTITHTTEIPIYSPYGLSSLVQKGITKEPIKITIPPQYQGGSAIVTLSDNLIGSMRDDLKYLIEYPYGCSEQISSGILAMHHATPFLPKDKLLAKRHYFIRQGIKKLLNRQNYYGEFTTWNDTEAYPNPDVSLYTIETLLELSRDGIKIDQDSQNQMFNLLHNIAVANNNYLGSYLDLHRLYAAYILALHHQLSIGTRNMLLEKKIYQKSPLATLYMAAILKIQTMNQKADQLYQQATPLLLHGSLKERLIHFLITTQHFKKDPKELKEIEESFDQLKSTQTRAIALKAVASYLDLNNSIHPFHIIFTNDKGEQKHYDHPITFKLDHLEGEEINIEPNASSVVTYSVELTKHLPKPPKNSLSADKPLSIMRQFVNQEKHPVALNNLKQGEKIYEKITIANRRKFNNVVVAELIPSCLSIVNRVQNSQTKEDSFSPKNLELQHQEIRDDRMLYFINLPLKKPQNIGVIYTPLIVSIQGQCQLPALTTEVMSLPEIQDYAKEQEKIIITAP